MSVACCRRGGPVCFASDLKNSYGTWLSVDPELRVHALEI